MSEKKKKRRTIIICSVAIFGVGCGLFVFLVTPIGHMLWPGSWFIKSDVPVFRCPNRFDPVLYDMDLRVRLLSDDSDVVLITRWIEHLPMDEEPSKWPVYQYDPATRQLTDVSPSRWASASGLVSEPYPQWSPPNFLLVRKSGILHYRVTPGPVRAFSTVGEYLLEVETLKTPPLVAVLSANGPKRPSFEFGVIPMMGGTIGGGYLGQHYVEFFRVPEMTRIGKAVRISLTAVEGLDTPCWSSDGRFLVYASKDGTKMCIIHVNEEKNAP